jgi:transcriptional regulator with XRE-family HTH domain
VDDLDRSIASRQHRNPRYGELVDAEVRRRRLVARLVAIRKANGLTQAVVAETMGVRQSVVAEIESARIDIRVSTLDRYAAAVSRGELLMDLAGETGGQPGSGSSRVAEVLTWGRPDLGGTDFWETASLDDLVAEQGTSAILDPERLILEEVSGREWDDFYAAMGLTE